MKIIKKIIFLIIIFTYFLFLNKIVFAESSLELIISDNEITLEDTFELDVKITADSSLGNSEILINWLNDFYKVSQKNYSSFTSINWKIENTQTIELSFYPNEVWEFEIGPAIIWEWTGAITSNIVKIKVISPKSSVKEEEIKNDTEDENNKELKPSVDNGNLKDIKDFEWSLGIFNYLYTIFIIILVILWYFIYKYFKINKKTQEKLIVKPEITKEDYIKKLKDLLNKIDKLEKSEFYEQLNFILRDYFDFIWIVDAKNKTFKEIAQNDIDLKLLKLFQKSYYNEFNLHKDTLSFRKDLIDDILKNIKK